MLQSITISLQFITIRPLILEIVGKIRGLGELVKFQ